MANSSSSAPVLADDLRSAMAKLQAEFTQQIQTTFGSVCSTFEANIAARMDAQSKEIAHLNEVSAETNVRLEEVSSDTNELKSHVRALEAKFDQGFAQILARLDQPTSGASHPAPVSSPASSHPSPEPSWPRRVASEPESAT